MRLRLILVSGMLLFLFMSVCGCQEKAVHMGFYTGTLEGYTYYYSDGWERQWNQ